MYKNRTDNFNVYLNSNIHLLKIYLLGFILFVCFRTAFLFAFANFAELNNYKTDLAYAYLTGLRFDTVVLAYGILLIFILNFFILFCKKAQHYYSTVKLFAFWYLLSIFFVFLIIMFVDFLFYMFFQSHFNKLLFGITQGMAVPVLKSIWTDFPVVTVFIATILITTLLFFVLKKIFKKQYKIKIKNTLVKVLIAIFITAVYLVALQGSISKFSLSQNDDSLISPNLFLNDLTLNSVFSLTVALSEFYGEKNGAIKKNLDFYKNYNSEELHKLLFSKTPKNSFLEKKPPHIIFIVMESMSSYYLDLHSSNLNLLGALEKHLPESIVFKNFLPSGNGTIQATYGLLIGNPDISLPKAQTTFINKPLLSSVALPFLKAGYHTSFITGDSLSFCHFGKFLPQQYFKTVEGSEILIAKVKNASAGTWGVYDEFVFERIFNKLEKSNGKPQFIFAVTVTNHTPFDLPKTYIPLPVKIPDNLLRKRKTDENLTIKNFTAYQYANNSLGKFLGKLKNSKFSDKTIVIVTGDHSTLQLFNFSYRQLLQKLSVPLIIHIPEKYKPIHKVNIPLFASHKDIFPTIFHLSLSDTEYFKTGNNLLDTKAPLTDFFAVNDNKTFMNKDGCLIMNGKPFFYRWTNNNIHLLEPTSLRKSPALENLLKNAKIHKDLAAHIKIELVK